MSVDTPSAGAKLPRTRGLKPPFNTETARAASLQAAKKASQRTKTRLDAAEVEKNARAYLVSHLPELIVALVNRARENPDGPAMARVLERALPMLQDQGSGRKVLEGLTLEISREGVKLQLPSQQDLTPLPPVDVQAEPSSISLSDKGLSTSSLPSAEHKAL